MIGALYNLALVTYERGAMKASAQKVRKLREGKVLALQADIIASEEAAFTATLERSVTRALAARDAASLAGQLLIDPETRTASPRSQQVSSSPDAPSPHLGRPCGRGARCARTGVFVCVACMR